MSKIRLEMEELTVETFVISPERDGERGTVRGLSYPLQLTNYGSCECETSYCNTQGDICTQGPGDTCWDECQRSTAPWNPCYTQNPAICTEYYPC